MCLALAQPMRVDTDVLCEGEHFREADSKASRESDLIKAFKELKS